MNVVVVESPAKARTINKYLGPDYTVLASYGHVRDLPAKDGSVDPAADFAMRWEIDGRADKHLKAIAQAMRSADKLFLATDPDREGEAISWHVREILAERKALGKADVKRVVFNEITKSAVLEAFRHPRELDGALIEAYLARRALDYLVGFTLSPVLWRKLPGSRSAGRVQSVALRLVCEREGEIEAFRPQEYWTVDATFLKNAGPEGAAPTQAPVTVTARLTRLDGRKLDKFDLKDEAAAKAAVAAVEARGFAVESVERRQVRRHPQPPFTTSTLQQEASRKLGFGATRTMRVAQRLYEGADVNGETVGLITYMRTDGVQISGDAIAAARRLIDSRYGGDYVPDAPRVYRTTAKNAQEAHEGIRPTDMGRTPESVARSLGEDERRLYELIWKRAVASQMESATIDQVAVDISSPDGLVTLRATGSTIRFDGFLRLYQEGQDDGSEDSEDRRLPPLAEGDALERREVTPEQHFTQPPPRYSEASLVKKLEELGIGRPSTYASILQVLQDRDYVRLDRRRFVPEDRGRLVIAFLTEFFDWLVQYNFTAGMEGHLDAISDGKVDWRDVLKDFWKELQKAVEQTKGLTITDVLNALDTSLGPHFFPEPAPGGRDPRQCPTCSEGRLSLKLGRFGAFIGCSRYPECRFTRPLVVDQGEQAGGTGEVDAGQPRVLGQDPGTGLAVTLRKGPYGVYVQLGEADGETKPKRQSLPRGLSPADVDLDRAVRLLALPRTVGLHPESGEPILAGIGRFGPYLKHGSTFKSLGRDDDVLTVGLNRAVDLLASARAGGGAGRDLGTHPADGKPVTVHRGRYGPYARHGSTRATLPRGLDPDALTLEEALPILAAKAGSSGGKAGARSGRRSPPARRGADAAPAAAAEARDRKAASKSVAAKTPARGAAKGKTAAKGKAAAASGKSSKTVKSPAKPPKPAATRKRQTPSRPTE